MKFNPLLQSVILGMAATTAAIAQTSTPNTPTCPASMQVTTEGASNEPKVSATEGADRVTQLPTGTERRSSRLVSSAPPGNAANTAVRVGNGLARLPDGTLCRPLDG